ncbi:alpha/beta hydrolase [Blastococcus montanus]|uniref:alpha/beta fold hydrolase n=1 Tax=Blastococcus montanus TaxID=3144973 RepID=UPI00320B3A2C
MTDVTSFDGTRLALYSWGRENAPLLVLVHGLGLSIDSWGDVPERLAADYRVVGYELRGHAQSGDARTGNYSLAAHAQDLSAVLGAAVPDGGSAVVVAHSLGGGILLEHVHGGGADDRIAGVVFAGSGGSGITVAGFPGDGLPRWARARVRSGWFTVLRTVARVGGRIRPIAPLADRLVRKAAFAPGEPRDLVEKVRDDFLTTRPLALAGTTLASVSHDGVRLAPSLTVPTLVVHGSEDPEVTDEEVEKLMAALPDAELVTVQGSGHMLALTDPDVVVEQTRRWMRRMSGDRPVQESTTTSMTG